MGETTAITLSSILNDVAAIVSSTGSNFSTLSTGFGYVLFIPVTLAMTKAVIGIIKSLLFFRRGRGRR